jgi:hypothetical protein
MGGVIEKASSLAGKPIESQDAIDVASILLNSGREAEHSRSIAV